MTLGLKTRPGIAGHPADVHFLALKAFGCCIGPVGTAQPLKTAMLRDVDAARLHTIQNTPARVQTPEAQRTVYAGDIR